jgi:hypothetical protein
VPGQRTLPSADWPTAPEPARAHRKPERSDRRHNDPKPPLRSSDASRSRRCSKAEVKTGAWSGPGPELVQAAKADTAQPAYAAGRAAADAGAIRLKRNQGLDRLAMHRTGASAANTPGRQNGKICTVTLSICPRLPEQYQHACSSQKPAAGRTTSALPGLGHSCTFVPAPPLARSRVTGQSPG